MTLWLGTPQVSHHPSKFGGHRHYGIGDTIALVCYVISQDQAISWGHVTLRVGASQGKLPFCQVW